MLKVPPEAIGLIFMRLGASGRRSYTRAGQDAYVVISLEKEIFGNYFTIEGLSIFFLTTAAFMLSLIIPFSLSDILIQSVSIMLIPLLLIVYFIIAFYIIPNYPSDLRKSINSILNNKYTVSTIFMSQTENEFINDKLASDDVLEKINNMYAGRKITYYQSKQISMETKKYFSKRTIILLDEYCNRKIRELPTSAPCKNEFIRVCLMGQIIIYFVDYRAMRRNKYLMWMLFVPVFFLLMIVAGK